MLLITKGRRRQNDESSSAQTQRQWEQECRKAFGVREPSEKYTTQHGIGSITAATESQKGLHQALQINGSTA